MANLFDGLQDKAFDVTLTVFGYDASWIPSATPDAEPLIARVHFKDPNEKKELSGVDYMPLAPFIEYRKPFFPGLYEVVREQNGGEIITVNGLDYHVRTVTALYDGRTYKAELEPVV